MNIRVRGRSIALLPAGLIAVAACGVPTGDSTFEQIATEEISPALAAPSTTTTTTTTTTTVPDLSATTIATTTTMAPETFETVEIYFLSRGLLRPVELSVAAPFASTDLIDLLEAGPPEAANNLDTAVPGDLVNGVEIQGGIVTIDIDRTVFDRIPRRDQQQTFAQLVFTFVNNLQAVGQALFTRDSAQFAVLRGDNRLTADPVSIDDYRNLLADQPVIPAPTTTTPPSTTVPPSTTAAPETTVAAAETTVPATPEG